VWVLRPERDERAVEAVPSVKRSLVDLKAGEVSGEDNTDEAAVRKTSVVAGYDVRAAT
jgi:hypothetical protein